jgi:hypothetical protein
MIRKLAILAVPLAAFGQTLAPPLTARISAPSLGYVFDDSAKAIRLISGVPGAAELGAAVSFPDALDSVFVNSRARIGIANTKEGRVALVEWTGTPRVTLLESGLARVAQASISKSGRWIAITDGAAVELWSRSPADLQKTSTFTPEQGAHALAVNDEGTVAVAGSLVSIHKDGSRVLTGPGDWTAIIFTPNGTDLLAADSSALALTRIRDAATAPSISVVGSLAQKTDAIVVSADETLAALASAERISVLSLASGAVNSVACHCANVRLESLEGNLVLHFADSESGAQLVADADSAEFRITTLLGGSAR